MKDRKRYEYKLCDFYYLIKAEDNENTYQICYTDISKIVPTIQTLHTWLLCEDFSKISLQSMENLLIGEHTIFLELNNLTVKLVTASKNKNVITVELV